MPLMRRLVLATAVAAVLWSAQPALAHNVIEEKIPAPGSTVTESPLAISISTDDVYLDLAGNTAGFGLVVRDEQGLYYGDGCVEVIERTMSASAELGEAGVYDIIYQFVSADGHSLSESYEFVFAPTENHVPAQGSADPAQCGVLTEAPSTEEATAVVEAVPISAEIPADDELDDSLLIGGFLALVGLAVAVWVAWRIRHRRDAS